MRTLLQVVLRAAFPFASAALACGCAVVVSQQAFIQDAKIDAPASSIPIHLASSVHPGQLTVSPSLSIGRKQSIEGSVEKHTGVGAGGVYAVDTIHTDSGALELAPGNNASPFTGSNMHWTTPSVTAGLSLDYPLSRGFALFGGVTYAGGASGDLWGGHVGLGLMSEGPVLGMRIDAGLQWVPISYSVASVVETVYEPLFSSRSYSRTAFYRDNGNSSPLGWFAGMTLNTRVPDWTIQPFVNLTLSKQRFFSLEPSTRDPFVIVIMARDVQRADVTASATLMLLSPGLSVEVGPNQRILLGARMAFLPDWISQSSTTASAGPVVAPFVQIDIGL